MRWICKVPYKFSFLFLSSGQVTRFHSTTGEGFEATENALLLYWEPQSHLTLKTPRASQSSQTTNHQESNQQQQNAMVTVGLLQCWEVFHQPPQPSSAFFTAYSWKQSKNKWQRRCTQLGEKKSLNERVIIGEDQLKVIFIHSFNCSIVRIYWAALCVSTAWVRCPGKYWDGWHSPSSRGT